MFGLAIAAMVVSIAMIACSKEDAPAQQEEPEFYTVKLGWGGEIVDIAYEPLDTRAAGNDLYGIQVYSKPNNNSTATSWEAYAYGVFDDPTDISIDLASGNKYKFVATMVVDGKEIIGYPEFAYEEDTKLYYGNPFRQTKRDDVGIFAYEGIDDRVYDHGDHFKSGTTYLKSEYEDNFVDRYYGEFEDFIPSSSNVEATISMKRVSFGAKFVAEGALAKSGVLKIGMNIGDYSDSGNYSVGISLTLTERDDSYSYIGPFADVYKAWAEDDYSYTTNVSFKWIRPDETELQIGTFPVTFKRNTTTVVTIKMDNDVVEGDQTGGVGFSIASTEKGEMPVDEDNSVTIVDGEVDTDE